MTTCQLLVSDHTNSAPVAIGLSGVLFSKETVCEKFQIAREKVVLTVTTTFKSGGDMSPPSHTKLRLCHIGSHSVTSHPEAVTFLPLPRP